MLEKLNECLPLLSEKERELVDLIYSERMPQEEIGSLYGVSQSTISRRNAKILAKLKKILEI